MMSGEHCVLIYWLQLGSMVCGAITLFAVFVALVRLRRVALLMKVQISSMERRNQARVRWSTSENLSRISSIERRNQARVRSTSENLSRRHRRAARPNRYHVV